VFSNQSEKRLGTLYSALKGHVKGSHLPMRQRKCLGCSARDAETRSITDAWTVFYRAARPLPNAARNHISLVHFITKRLDRPTKCG